MGADSVWHCLLAGPYTPGSGNIAATGSSAMSWGGAGMAGWGSTCGIIPGCALFAEYSLPRTGASGTNAAIDKIFAHFAEGEHPINEEWFVTGKVNPQPVDLVDFKFKYGSLQCHNVVVQHLNEEDFTDCGLADPRGEFCARLVGAMCYETMKQVGTAKLGLPAIPATPFSTVRNGCSVTGCHTATSEGSLRLGSGFLPKENCYACHK
jgi:hypothetical protein